MSGGQHKTCVCSSIKDFPVRSLVPKIYQKKKINKKGIMAVVCAIVWEWWAAPMVYTMWLAAYVTMFGLGVVFRRKRWLQDDDGGCVCCKQHITKYR